jgi:hypothetical protein
MLNNRPDFIQQQYAFTAHIRNPAESPRPDGIEERRMKIYRELFFNNVEGLLSGTFPVLRGLLEGEQWLRLIRDYFSQHQAHTPLFTQMPREFLRYLEEEREPKADDPAFLWELAHYEWVELALAIDTRDITAHPEASREDLLNKVAQVSPLAWFLAYQFPVQQICQDFQPNEVPEQATYLLVYRDVEYNVGFLELNPISAHLMATLTQNDNQQTGQVILQDMATQMQHPNPELVIQGGLDILQQWQAKHIIFID